MKWWSRNKSTGEVLANIATQLQKLEAQIQNVSSSTDTTNKVLAKHRRIIHDLAQRVDKHSEEVARVTLAMNSVHNSLESQSLWQPVPSNTLYADLSKEEIQGSVLLPLRPSHDISLLLEHKFYPDAAHINIVLSRQYAHLKDVGLSDDRRGWLLEIDWDLVPHAWRATWLAFEDDKDLDIWLALYHMETNSEQSDEDSITVEMALRVRQVEILKDYNFAKGNGWLFESPPRYLQRIKKIPLPHSV